MELKELGMKVFELVKPEIKSAAKKVVVEIVVPELVDPAIDYIKVKIPGEWDDAILEGAKPKIKEALVKLIEEALPEPKLVEEPK